MMIGIPSESGILDAEDNFGRSEFKQKNGFSRKKLAACRDRKEAVASVNEGAARKRPSAPQDQP